MTRAALRLTETVLLVTALAAGAIGLATIALVQAGAVTARALQPILIIGAAVLVLHISMGFVARRADQLLLPLATMLTAVSIIEMERFAADPNLAPVGPGLPGRQVAWVLLGLGVLLATLVTPRLLPALRSYRYVWLLGGIVLVALTLVFGEDVTGTGTRMWINLGPISIQPSELLKVLMVAFLASYLDERRELLAGAATRLGPLRLPPVGYLLPLLFVWGFSLALLVLQEDLGAALFFFFIFVAMLYMATGRASYVLFSLLLFAVGAVFAYGAFSHVQARVAIWLDPWADPTGRGYQPIQTLLALASGGLFGVGLGYGHPGLIPAVFTDVVIAALGEEIGAAGVLAILAIYAVLVVRGLMIALRVADSFYALLAAGLSMAIGIQTLIIVGGTLRVIPLTGITLPLISYGGSSLLTNYLILGLLLRISMERRVTTA